MKSLVIVPTYNEAENVCAISNKILSLDEKIHTLIIDDNSPDKTADLVKSHKMFQTRIHLIERSGKLGLGTAYVEGFRWALKKNYDIVVTMDCDFSHAPKDILLLMESLTDENACSIGSRYINGIRIINWPFKRLILSYLASIYVRFILQMPIHDPTGGFNCYTKNALRQINLNQVFSNGYCFQVEMKYRLFCSGTVMKEAPIVFNERQKGASKMGKSIVFEAIFNVLKLRLLSLFKML